jgi:hypothetical protein
VFLLTKIPYIYWTIAYTPKPLFGEVFKVGKIRYIYWPIKCTSKASFEQLL